MPVASAIIFPAPKSVQVHDGFIDVSGWAFSGGGRWIERVEVSTDGGFKFVLLPATQLFVLLKLQLIPSIFSLANSAGSKSFVPLFRPLFVTGQRTRLTPLPSLFFLPPPFLSPRKTSLPSSTMRSDSGIWPFPSLLKVGLRYVDLFSFLQSLSLSLHSNADSLHLFSLSPALRSSVG